MARRKYEIREICGDWALDIHWGKETITLFFNSRNNAELVKTVLEWEDLHPNEASPYHSTLTPPPASSDLISRSALLEGETEPEIITGSDSELAEHMEWDRWMDKIKRAPAVGKEEES